LEKNTFLKTKTVQGLMT